MSNGRLLYVVMATVWVGAVCLFGLAMKNDSEDKSQVLMDVLGVSIPESTDKIKLPTADEQVANPLDMVEIPPMPDPVLHFEVAEATPIQ